MTYLQICLETNVIEFFTWIFRFYNFHRVRFPNWMYFSLDCHFKDVRSFNFVEYRSTAKVWNRSIVWWFLFFFCFSFAFTLFGSRVDFFFFFLTVFRCIKFFVIFFFLFFFYYYYYYFHSLVIIFVFIKRKNRFEFSELAFSCRRHLKKHFFFPELIS